MKSTDKTLIIKILDFLKDDIWRIRVNRLTGQKPFWIRQLRILLLAGRGFAEDKCQLRASALTFYSLLSVVPVVAMAFGIAKGFGFEKVLESQLYEKMQGQEEVISKVIGFSNAMLENTQGGLIAGIGIGILFWTVIKVLGNIESSFNDIWGIKRSRSMGRKFSDYLSIMLICPILLIMSSSVTVVITSQIHLIIDKISFLGPILPAVLTILKLLPYLVIWSVFTFIYVFMPNTNVQFKSGFLGGIVAGTTYQLVQWIYINFQVGVSKSGAIYGSFAALPLFLIWLQVSWLVVLLGAEVSFAEQNVETYEFEPDCLKVSHSFKRLVAVSVTHLCVKNFHKADDPWSADEISHELEVPIRLLRQVLFELTEAKVLSEVKMSETNVIGYQPAHDIADMTVKNILQILDNHGIDSLPVNETKEHNLLRTKLLDIYTDSQSNDNKIFLKDI